MVSRRAPESVYGPKYLDPSLAVRRTLEVVAHLAVERLGDSGD